MTGTFKLTLILAEEHLDSPITSGVSKPEKDFLMLFFKLQIIWGLFYNFYNKIERILKAVPLNTK
jgi:hypothetical protein